MHNLHEAFWPKRLPRTLDYPAVPLFRLVEVAAEYYPEKAALIYYGQEISYRRLDRDIKSLAGALAKRGVQKGDRVAVYMQNSPLYIIAFFAVMRANAVVVPVNPMNNEKELAFILEDSEAVAAITTTDLLPRAEKVRERVELKCLVAGRYQDYLPDEPTLAVPEFMLRAPACTDSCLNWQTVLDEQAPPPVVQVGSDDMCLLPYTSGSTGVPKGCMHTNRTVISNVVSAYYWLANTASSVHLSVLPFFHVTGLVHSMLAPLYAGATLVLLTRWDRRAALDAIEKYRVSHWVNISTMVVDLLSAPDIARRNLSTLVILGGGGAPLPGAIGRKLLELTGLEYVEGYGLTETISQTHFNPPDRPKMQCIGIPDFGVDARVINVETLEELPSNTAGELVINGPEVFQGYWKRPEETANAFLELDGKRFFRTGDVCYMDDEGYFFIVDRTKRMINAAGFKVWPAEVENNLYNHPAVQETCVVGVPDPVRVEEVRAYIVLKEAYRDKVTDNDIITWSKGEMAAYKYPRQVLFVDALPKSATGKILWRQVQEEARAEFKGGK
ncbi:long-chain-fatty-acid--CoA ligase [Desulfoscipio gibsoniae]